MEFLKQWTFCTCVSLVVASIFSLLVPQGSMQRFFKLLIAAFVFISFLVPFQNVGKFDFDLSKIEITDELQLSQSTAAQSMVDSEVAALLREHHIDGASVQSSVNYDIHSGEIDIKDLQVAIGDAYSTQEVESLIFDNLGLKARVIQIGD